jgi:hypothetical protein
MAHSERVRGVLLAVAVWFHALVGELAAVRDALARRRETLTRMRGDTRAETDAKTVVATGAGVASSGGLVALIKDYWIGGSIYQLSLSTVNLIQSAGTIGKVFSAFGSSVAGLVESAIPSEIVDAGVWASSMAIRQDFGVSGFVVAVIVTMVGVGAFMWFVANIDWSPTQFLRGRG